MKIREYLIISLFLVLGGLFVTGGQVVVKDGKLNVTEDFFVNSNTLYVDSANNRVGIGTSTPGATLEIMNTSAVDSLLNVSDGSNTLLFVNTTKLGSALTGSVGIGTADPSFNGQISSRFTVVQDGSASNSAITVGNTTTPAFALVAKDDGSWIMYDFNTGSPSIGLTQKGGNFGMGGTTSPKNKLDVGGGVAVGIDYSGVSTAPSDGMIIEGSVGIGTTTPDAGLTINGNSSTSALGIVGNLTSWYFNGGLADAWLRLYSTTSGTTLADLAVGNFYTQSTAYLISNTYFGGNTGILTSDGKVGIGTTTPDALLDINHETPGTYTGLLVKDDSTGDFISMGIQAADVGAIDVRDGTGGKTLALQSNGGKVGIGTASPAYSLEVEKNNSAVVRLDSGDTNHYLDIANVNDGAGNWYWYFYPGTAQTESINFFNAANGVNRGIAVRNYGGSWNNMNIFHNDAYGGLQTSGSTPLVLQGTSNNVGIGTTSPDTKLDVNGEAEITDTTTGSNAGTSLCIDANNRICRCGSCA